MTQIKVVMKLPGVKSCGAFKHGKEYEVDAPEALRLVRVKGFELVNAKDESKLLKLEKELKAAAEKAAADAEMAKQEAS